MTTTDLDAYLKAARELTLAEIRALLPANDRYRTVLYDLMLDYPLRTSKALRPALCIAACRALGGPVESVLRSAAVIELYHNAFLIHDDVEDGSETRRDRPTLHTTYGTSIAVNVGDAMLALALQPLLDNMQLIGLGKALRVMEIVARMARESTEGQAIELAWIREGTWDLRDSDYVRMVYKKTSWYTFVAPVMIGSVVAGAALERLRLLRNFAALLGIAFQIQDDCLNLMAEADGYGKETAGDLWEGKRTLIALHMVSVVSPEERERVRAIFALPRVAAPHDPTRAKREADIDYLRALIERTQSLEYARRVAERYARNAERLLRAVEGLSPSVHRDFLFGLTSFVINRHH